MKSHVKIVAILLFFFFFLLTINQAYTSSPHISGNSDDQYIEGELLVKFMPGTPGLARGEAHRGVGASLIKDFPSLRLEHVELPRGLSVQAAIASYENNPNIEYAEPNYIVSADAVPNDPSFNQLWSLHNDGQTGGTVDADIDAPEAWDITTGIANTVVAVIDTGIDYNHEDLAPNMWTNQAELYGTAGVDDDANGYVDDIFGIDTINGDSDPMDDHFHGTHVAGTVGAAGNNGIGVTGINWDISIIACKFLGSDGYGSTAGAVECLDYLNSLKQSGINVVASNNSWGSFGYSQALEDAINAQQDILFFAAAGNLGMDMDLSSPYYPASYDLPNIVTVTATNHNDGQVYNYGRYTVDVGAPGYDIYSTMPGNSYDLLSGTSMATPHATGVAALIKSQDEGRDWRAIRNLLLSGGDTLTSLENKTISGKRLNAYGSLNCTDSPVFSAVKYPLAPEIGVPATLSALSINCDAAVGPVTVAVPGGGEVDLYDDGIAPDLAMGDGTFAGTWTPTSGDGKLVFSSSAGTEIYSYFTITSRLMAEGEPGVFYSQTLEAVRGVEPISWSLSSGSLPDGLSLDGATGVISGIPTSLGTTSFSVQATDAEGTTDALGLKIDIVDEAVLASMVKIYDSLRNDRGRAVEVDSAGNIYVVGASSNGSDDDWITIKYDASGNFVWSRKYDSGVYNYVYDMAIDENDHVYVAGDNRIFKYDPGGNLLWSRERTYSQFFEVKADGNGFIYLSGTSGSDYLISKYDTSGNLIWERTHDFGAYDQAYGVAVDGSGNVYATGFAMPGADYNIYTVKYNSAGTLLWSRTFDGGSGEIGVGAVADADGNLYISAGSGTEPFFADQALILKYDTSGNLAWSRYYSLGSRNSFEDVAIDGSGNPVVTGYSRNFNDDVITVKYDPYGNEIWTRISDLSYPAFGSGVSVGENDTTYVVGTYDRWTDDDILLIKYTVDLGITTVVLPDAGAGAFYSQTLTAEGGSPPYSWAIANGTLPDGLVLNSTTGEISDVPTTTGVFNFVAQVTDSALDTSSRPLSITVHDPPSITTSSLPDGEFGASYSETLTATGGVPPYSWSIVSGSLPDGLALNGSTGEISGTPTSAGPFTFTALVTDSVSSTDTGSVSITITDAVVITTSSLPDGETETTYSETLTAMGGQPPYSWGIVNGTLPSGLNLNSTTGDIYGTPTTGGTSNFTVQVTDAGVLTDSRPLSITVLDPPSITTSSLPDGETGTPYSETLTAAGGQTPYSWGLVNGTLPNGLNLNSTTGDIYGTPTTGGMYTFTVQVTDAMALTDAKPLSITVHDPFSIVTSSLPDGEVDVFYSQTLTAAGGQPPYSWGIVNGTLPNGLNLNSTTGDINGTPTTGGTYNFTVQVTDANNDFDSRALSLSIYDPPLITTPFLIEGNMNSFYSQTLEAIGGVAPITWSITIGMLPPGLSLDSASGEISGTPTMEGQFNFTVEATGADGSKMDRNFLLKVVNSFIIAEWVEYYDGSTDPLFNSADMFYDVATDSEGNIYAAGYTLNSANWTYDFLIVKYDPSGSVLWARTYDGGWDERSLGISIDGSGNAVVTGESIFWPSVPPFDPEFDMVTVKYDTSGNLIWARTLDKGFNETAQDVALDAAGNVYITGIGFTNMSSSDDDILTAIYDPNGNLVSDWSLDRGSTESGSGIAVDSGGNVIVSGAVIDGSKKFFTVKYDPTGAIMWERPETDEAHAWANDVAVDGMDNIYAVGAILNTVVTDSEDVLVYKYDPSGNIIWKETFYDLRYEEGVAIDLDESGNVYISGNEMFPEPQFIVLKYGPDGSFLWERRYLAGHPDYANEAQGIAVDASGNAYVAGFVSSDFNYDAVLVKFSQQLVITSSFLPGGETGTPYSETLTAAGGQTPYSWGIVNGTLPNGLNLNSTTGVISGTPTTAGTSNFTAQVTDANFAIAAKDLSITITDPLVITTSSLPDGAVDVSYSEQLTASGGVEPYSWAIVNGILPDGLFYGSNGVISGTPTTPGTFNFTAQVTDANSDIATKDLSITITDPLVITTSSLPYSVTGRGYNNSLTATGGIQPYSWAIVNGVLPDGLSLNGSTGAISGISTITGEFNFTAQVTDANLDTATRDLSIPVYDQLSISTSSLPYGVTGRAYSDSLTATGGLEPYSWQIMGTLPDGLTLDGATGDISGTPTTSGVFNFTVWVSDANLEFVSQLLSISIYDPVVVDTASLPYGVTGRAYSDTLTASGGLAPYSWEITNGVLPDGLSLNGTTGDISGTPTTTGSYSFTVQATDANSETGVKDLSISVYDQLSITTSSLSYGVTGRTYSEGISATGGLTPYTWSIVAGVLPDGLTLDGASGVISGTPTTSGMSNFTVQAMDANGETATQALSILIYDAVVVDTVSLPYGVTGRAYSDTLSASGGVPPYTWSIVSGSLPDGLSLDGATGAITGTPTMTGVFNFTVQATDDIGETGSRALSIAVYDPVSISTTSLPNGDVGTAYNEVLAASGGLTPYAWSITAGSLPDGLSLDGVAGVISGTPTTSGIFDFTVGIADANSETASQDLSITVGKTTTYYVLTASGCNASTYPKGPQYAQLGTASGDCSTGDSIRWKFKDGPNDMLVGYLANGGYTTDTAVTGAATGNDLSFFINGSGGTGYVHLAEVNPSDGTVIHVLSTVSVSVSPDTLTSVTNISALSGTVSAGNTVGIVLSMASTEREFHEITWGTTGGGPGLEQWFTVTETPLGSAP